MDLTLCLTHDCNLACSYCYAGHKRAVVMTRETAAAALDLAFRELRTGKLQLSFFGGEPLLEWDTLAWATDRARGMAADAGVDLQLTVTTNATLLTDERVAWLTDREFALGISIDGDRESHDRTRPARGGGSSFDRTLAGLCRALPHSPNAEAIFVVDPANVDRVLDGTRFLADQGVRCISLNPNFYTAWSDDRLAVWEEQYARVADLFVERFRASEDLYINFVDGKILTRLKEGFSCADRCSFGEGEIAVAPSGRIYPCERLVGDDSGELAIGQAETGFDELARLAVIARRGNHDGDCDECALKERFMNWCGCINHATTGAIDKVSALVCFHEQLCIREADRAAEILWAEQNPLFLRKYYGESR